MQKSLLISAITIALLLLFQNCGMRLHGLTGTETGNAMSVDNQRGDQGKTTAAQQLVARLCQAQVACQPDLDFSECQTKLDSAQGVPQSFGVEPGSDIVTMKDLAQAEQNGELTITPASLANCQTEISATSCATISPMVGAASPTGFANAAQTVASQAPSCSSVF